MKGLLCTQEKLNFQLAPPQQAALSCTVIFIPVSSARADVMPQMLLLMAFIKGDGANEMPAQSATAWLV